MFATAAGLLLYGGFWREAEDGSTPQNHAERETIVIGVMNGPVYHNASVTFITRLAESRINQYCADNQIDMKFSFEVTPPTDASAVVFNHTDDFHRRGVDLIVGYPWDSMFWPAIHYANEAGLVVVSTGSNQLEVARPDSAYRLIPSNPKTGRTMALCAWSLGVTNVVVVSNPQNGVSRNTADAFVKAFMGLGGNVVLRYDYSSDEVYSRGYGPMLSSLEADVDRLLESPEPGEVAVFYEPIDMFEALIHASANHPTLTSVRWFTSRLSADYEEYWETGEEAAVVRLMGCTPAPSGPVYEEVSEVYERELGEPLSLIHANLYDGCWLLALSVIEAGSYNASAVNQTLTEVAAEYTGASGRCLLDRNGDRESMDYVIYRCAVVEGKRMILPGGAYRYAGDSVEWDEGRGEP